ncbi:hypothetical protein [Neptunomonas antarctica]|uniref:Uncharacterized protein n=1 Tax=Neptunomonas antarctica TaxID=619304 RepID=A0A1N7M6X0_9GAMM|nr:hypothetical protein [Neptunomonas antarctica]SIS81830.1 hypothetical protein SAMN05421760_105222 [Neptunomonas antarctica]
MYRSLLVLLIIVIVITGYLFLPPTGVNDVNNKTTDKTSLQPKTPNLTTLNDKERAQAISKIEKMIAPSEIAIDASTAHHFVTGDQLIRLPATSDARVSILQTNDVENDTSVQTFSVTPPSFTPHSNQPSENNTSLQQIKNIGRPSIGTQIRLKELLDQSDTQGKRIFYIHAVNQNDAQGIWGILQSGLTDTFAKGITISTKKTLVKATIPHFADETLVNSKSSFLGKLLHNKVETTHIYNFQEGLLGQNPNLIKPGQQLIIVTFTEEELLDVYRNFAQQGQTE